MTRHDFFPPMDVTITGLTMSPDGHAVNVAVTWGDHTGVLAVVHAPRGPFPADIVRVVPLDRGWDKVAAFDADGVEHRAHSPGWWTTPPAISRAMFSGSTHPDGFASLKGTRGQTATAPAGASTHRPATAVGR